MAGGVVGFITQGDMGAQLALDKPVVQCAMQHDGGLAAGQTPYLAMPPGHGHAHTQTNGFAESLLHRKPCRQKTHASVGPTGASGAKGVHLGFAQHLQCETLAMALKGASEQARTFFLSNMSTRAAKNLEDDMGSLGPVRLKEVDEAQQKMVLLTKDLAAKGEIMISKNRAEDELVY